MLFLLTGGSACGKSTYAEQLAALLPGPHYYLATMRPEGAAGQARIARHRAQRQGLGFATVERYTDIGGLKLPECGTVMLECLCNLTANEMFAEHSDAQLKPAGSAGRSAGAVRQAILHGVAQLEDQCENLLVVTNDIGGDGGEYDDPVLAYIQTLGEINASLAQRYENVYELCCGFPVALKGELLMSNEPRKGGANVILVVGSMASGKRDYVTNTLGYAESALADAVLDERPVLLNLQNLVKSDPENALALLPELRKKAVVVCNEVGSGVIPANRADTAWREATGRICNALAAEASSVIRMICGVPTVLKP